MTVRVCVWQLPTMVAHRLPPFHARLAHTHTQVSKAHLSEAGRARSRGLEALLANPLLERFAANLHLLVHPQTRWEGVLRQLGVMAADDKAKGRPVDAGKVGTMDWTGGAPASRCTAHTDWMG